MEAKQAQAARPHLVEQVSRGDYLLKQAEELSARLGVIGSSLAKIVERVLGPQAQEAGRT